MGSGNKERRSKLPIIGVRIFEDATFPAIAIGKRVFVLFLWTFSKAIQLPELFD